MGIEGLFDQTTNTKVCLICKEQKPASQFYKQKRGSGGIHQYCSRCFNRYTEERRRLPERKQKRRAYIQSKSAGDAVRARNRRSAKAARERYPEKQAARKAVRRALDLGTLTIPAACEVCRAVPSPDRRGGRTLHAHHDDYEQPLSVRWLCRACHVVAHHVALIPSRPSQETTVTPPSVEA